MGYGDYIMASGFARIAKEKYPHHQVIIGNKNNGDIYYSDIFKNNPLITTAKEFDIKKKAVWVESFQGNRPYISKEKAKQSLNDLEASGYKIPPGLRKYY